MTLVKCNPMQNLLFSPRRSFDSLWIQKLYTVPIYATVMHIVVRSAVRSSLANPLVSLAEDSDSRRRLFLSGDRRAAAQSARSRHSAWRPDPSPTPGRMTLTMGRSRSRSPCRDEDRQRLRHPQHALSARTLRLVRLQSGNRLRSSSFAGRQTRLHPSRPKMLHMGRFSLDWMPRRSRSSTTRREPIYSGRRERHPMDISSLPALQCRLAPLDLGLL